NSTNGTWCNGLRLMPNESREIRRGDEICLGNLVFDYR
ncbi:MAG: FHA domain-containing protein, partial [Lachnospiraceae bacterium]|nr:FHA domain-containing protein [Lachnospiraceae bacterium]